MIRINLIARRRRIETHERSQIWMVAVLGVLFAEIVVLVVYHGLKVDELRSQERKNAELAGQIDLSKKSVGKHTEILEKLGQLRAREEAITKLQSARSGPTSILLELSRILTPGRGPSVDPERMNQIRRDSPLSAFNPNWDTRRLWILTFKEEKRRMRIEGLARDGEDISELARRMSVSDYFASVKLLPARREFDSLTKIELMRFAVEAEVKY